MLSSRLLLALPPLSSPRTSPSERTKREAEDGGRCSFSLAFLSRLQRQDLTKHKGVCMTAEQRRGDAHGHESPRPPRTALSQQREEISMSRRGRAASEGRGRRCNRATGGRLSTAVSGVPPPPHVRILANFTRLLPLASYCSDATERRASAAPKATEIHKTRNPRPFTGPFFGPYMHPNRPLDPKIVFNQHTQTPEWYNERLPLQRSFLGGKLLVSGEPSVPLT